MKIHNIDEFANPKMTKIPDLASCDLLSGYDSPIKIIATQMEAKMENDILTAVQHFDINVNKDELIKALDYDRKQYEAGYQAGYQAGYEKAWQHIHELLSPIQSNDMLFGGCGIDKEGNDI